MFIPGEKKGPEEILGCMAITYIYSSTFFIIIIIPFCELFAYVNLYMSSRPDLGLDSLAVSLRGMA